MLFEDFSVKGKPHYYRVADHALNNDLSVIEVGYNRMPAGLKKATQRNVYILHYITEGKGSFLNQSFNNKNAYLVVPGEYEVFQADEHSHYDTYWIIFKGAMAETILNLCGLKHTNHVFEFDATKECGEILHRTIFDIKPKNSAEEAALMYSCFYELISIHLKSIRTEPKNTQNIAEKIKRFIDNNYYQQISLNELFEKYGYTRNHIYNMFKARYHISPKEYLMDVRIKKAKHLLSDKTSTLTISEIANTVGFNDPLYFSRIFKKKTSNSPSEFKHSFR